MLLPFHLAQGWFLANLDTCWSASAITIGTVELTMISDQPLIVKRIVITPYRTNMCRGSNHNGVVCWNGMRAFFGLLVHSAGCIWLYMRKPSLLCWFPAHFLPYYGRESSCFGLRCERCFLRTSFKAYAAHFMRAILRESHSRCSVTNTWRTLTGNNIYASGLHPQGG